jgi:hypothetical protein
MPQIGHDVVERRGLTVNLRMTCRRSRERESRVRNTQGERSLVRLRVRQSVRRPGFETKSVNTPTISRLNFTFLLIDTFRAPTIFTGH